MLDTRTQGCRDAWAAAERELGWGADHAAMIRWLERLTPPKTATGA